MATRYFFPDCCCLCLCCFPCCLLIRPSRSRPTVHWLLLFVFVLFPLLLFNSPFSFSTNSASSKDQKQVFRVGRLTTDDFHSPTSPWRSLEAPSILRSWSNSMTPEYRPSLMDPLGAKSAPWNFAGQSWPTSNGTRLRCCERRGRVSKRICKWCLKFN